jgi:uncharacterized protein (TIGR02145 family)
MKDRLARIAALLLALYISNQSAFSQIKSVKIGNLVWSAENMNVNLPGSWTYNGTKANGDKYGRLYTWAAAQKVCPAGWHLPSSNEWEQLVKALGGEEVAGEKIKINGSSGFNAQMAGYSNGGNFWFLESYGGFWTASSFDKEHAWYFYFTKKESSLTKTYFSKSYGFSVRCVKNK